MTDKRSRTPAFFERIYARNKDPWDFAGSAYEAEKYRATVAALGGRRFRAGFEVGCSVGVLTAMLAPLCDHLLAADVVDTALQEARRRCGGMPGLTFEKRAVPDEWPGARKFDLIVFSEILYFFAVPDIARLGRLAAGALLPGGVVLLVNYLGALDEPVNGDEAAAAFCAATARWLRPAAQSRAARYRIDVLTSGV